MTNLQSLDFYWPELILTGVIVLAIILDLLLDKKDSGKVGWVLILGLITVALAIYIQAVSYTHLTLPTINSV